YNPGVVFVLAGLCVCFTSLLFSASSEMKLFSFLMLLTVLVVPLGSNNGLYPLLNCLFLFAPYSLNGILMMGFWDSNNRKERGVFAQYLIRSEALRVFGWCFTGLLLLISLGNGFFYVFGDAPRKQLSARLTGEPVSGIFTTQEKAELFTKIREKAAASGAAEILIYGDMPGLSYYLKLPPAIDTTWPNLASYPAISFQRQLSEIEKKASGWPLVVVAPCNEENPEKEKALEAFLVGHYREEASFSTAEGEVRMFFLVDISKE
ncbi:MAG: hypothetical protein IJU50_05935, partial [Lachnospiraceae bacterium]|nr:hypothetical protein [Lachnospiraceae bacterium]